MTQRPAKTGADRGYVPAALATLPLAARLLWRSGRYRWLRATGGAAHPQAVSIEVTRRCIAKCVMCGIWRSPSPSPELTTDDWLALLSRPLLANLRELDITGGEPYLLGGRLTDLIRGAAALKGTALRRLRSVAITTNGLLTDEVVEQTGLMLEALAGTGIELVIVCALDAVGPAHDEVRRVPGAWTRLEESLAGLKGLRLRHPGLVIGIKATVLPSNSAQLAAIAEYAEVNGFFAIVSPFILTEGRYLNADLREQLSFSDADRRAMADFYRSSSPGWDYHRKAMIEYLETGRMRRPCSCGFNYFFVRSSGEVFLCPLLAESVGSVTEDDIETLWSSATAGRIRRRVGRFPQCSHCTEPGLERYSLPFEGYRYLCLLRRLGPRRFMVAHKQAGLDKYL
jgi:MoaA/NifB/PqqE/SkfB family radical SAM enzyme